MLKRFAAVAALVIGLICSGVSVASATDPVNCPPGTIPNPTTGECVIVVTTPPPPPPGGGGGGGGGGAGGASHEKCLWSGEEIPCTRDSGYWSNDLLCYVGKPSVTHPPSDPIWEGHYPDGAIYGCYNPFITGTNYTEFWAASPPAGPAAPPDPRVLAQQAIAIMNLKAVNIGIVPEDAPGRVGVIGLPTWMWADGPNASTMGPITRSASAGGYTVTATAKVTRVVWSMGNGDSVTCTGPGTPYADKYGKSSSPTCGYTYTRQGRYTVTATSYWTVDWAGIGQTGTIPLDFSRSTAITMGEAQVINR